MGDITIIVPNPKSIKNIRNTSPKNITNIIITMMTMIDV